MRNLSTPSQHSVQLCFGDSYNLYAQKKAGGIHRMSRQDLINLKKSSVYVSRFDEDAELIGTRFYLKVIPEFTITKCDSCNKVSNDGRSDPVGK